MGDLEIVHITEKLERM